jgi:hypothetical protein
MFSATVEAGLKLLGAPWDRLRVDYALRQHEQWYKGDGTYGDGPSFHWDYYNSFVIQPMLLDVLEACGDESQAWSDMRTRLLDRARRYGAILERLVGPDGSFPAVGRSLAYRCGAFHLLAALALGNQLPDGLPPAQARAALAAVIRRTLDAPGTFDANGWLTIGLAGHQPGIGERYISTGSLYLCAVAFLPLGLAADHAFWTGPDIPTTAMRASADWHIASYPIRCALLRRRRAALRWARHWHEFAMSFTDLTLSFVSAVAPAAVAAVGAAAEVAPLRNRSCRTPGDLNLVVGFAEIHAVARDQRPRLRRGSACLRRSVSTKLFPSLAS